MNQENNLKDEEVRMVTLPLFEKSCPARIGRKEVWVPKQTDAGISYSCSFSGLSSCLDCHKKEGYAFSGAPYLRYLEQFGEATAQISESGSRLEGLTTRAIQDKITTNK